jgi:NitT/TauT family transport system substrate-binding protein
MAAAYSTPAEFRLPILSSPDLPYDVCMTVSRGRLAGVLVSATLLVCSLAAPAAAQEPPLWRHGVLEAKSDSGIIMMVGRGFGERYGIKIKLVQFKSDVVEMQALLSGELDSFDSGPYLSIVAASRGADVKVMACPWPGMPYGILARKAIASIDDLKGKSIAISAPGASPDLVARALLRQHQFTTADVRLVNLGGDVDRYKALAAGIVDAAVATIEYIPIAEPQGIRVLVLGRDVLPKNMRFCMVSTGANLKARRDDAARFLAAEMTAWRYAVAHRDEALALTRTLTGSKPEDPRAGYFFDDAVKSKSIDPDLSIPVDKLQWAADELLANGTLTRRFDATQMADLELRKTAAALVKP